MFKELIIKKITIFKYYIKFNTIICFIYIIILILFQIYLILVLNYLHFNVQFKY